MRIAIFVDGTNLIESTRRAFQGRPIGATVGRILANLLGAGLAQAGLENGTVVARRMFLVDDKQYTPLADDIEAAGFTLHRIAAPKLSERDRERSLSRADDRALADAVQAGAAAGQFDTCVLVTNDGDFISLVDKLETDGISIVLGYLQPPGRSQSAPRVNANLAKAVPRHVRLFDLADMELAPMASKAIRPMLRLFMGETCITTCEMGTETLDIGRSSKKFGRTDVDLAEWDKEKILSRRHLSLRFSGGQLIARIPLEASRPTWCNDHLLEPGESCLLVAGTELVLGDADDGFRLEIAVASLEDQ